MGQYALGQAIKEKSGMPIYYDIEWYDYYGKDCSGRFNRNWELERVFPLVTVKRASAKDIGFYKKCFNKRYNVNGTVYIFIEEILLSRYPRYLGEYYVDARYLALSEKHLREQLAFNTNSFSVDTQKMAETIINTTCAVALQVRRGDFVTIGADKVSPPEYFYRALDSIEEMIWSIQDYTVYVFSDDIAYCKNMLSSRSENFFFVDINDNDNGAQDMYLMSLCRHFTISEIDFGWCGTFLSELDVNKIVILPKIWFNQPAGEANGMKLEGWIGL